MSHGHATTIVVDEIKGTIVPTTEEKMAKGQNERSVEDAMAVEN